MFNYKRTINTKMYISKSKVIKINVKMFQCQMYKNFTVKLKLVNISQNVILNKMFNIKFNLIIKTDKEKLESII
jgi:hypothetical protein